MANLLIALFSLIFLTVILVIIFYAGHYMYTIKSLETNGLLIFYINKDNKTIIRLNNAKFYKELNIGINSIDIKANKFYDMENLMNFLEEEQQKKIIEYFNSESKKRFNIYSKLNKKITQSRISKKIKKLLKIKQDDEQFLLKFYPTIDKNDYFLIIRWNYKSSYSEGSKNLVIVKDQNQFLNDISHKYILSLSLAVREEFYAQRMNNDDLNDIAKLLGIKNDKVFVYLKNGVLSFITHHWSKLRFKHLYKKYLAKINYFKEINLINPYFDYYALVGNKMISNQNDLKNFENKNFYLIHHLQNKLDFKKYCSWALEDAPNNDFESYIAKMNDYESKNEFENYIKNTYVVESLRSKKTTNVKVLQNIVAGFNGEDLNFFLKIPWYRLMYSKKWNDYLVKNSNKTDTNIIFTNEYDLLNNAKNYTNENTILMVKPRDTMINFKIISHSLSNLIKENINIGIYIDSIDTKLLNFISNGNVNVFIVSKNICSTIKNQSDGFLKLYALLQIVAKIKNNLVIFENIDPKIDEYFVKKLNINYFYELKK